MKRTLALIAFAVAATTFGGAANAQYYKRETLNVKPLPYGANLTISHSYKKPGHASLNFTATNVENSCTDIQDYNVETRESINIIEIEFNHGAVNTYRMLDENNHDLCAQHSYAQYRFPLDLKGLSERGFNQMRIWNGPASDAFKINDLGNNEYEIVPVTAGNYFKISNAENILRYKQMPANAFRIFPDYAPYNEELMLRKVRALARASGYELLDYTVHYDDRKRPYYILLDNKDMEIVTRLKDERFILFDEIDIDEQGRLVPLRINIGRL